MGKLILCRGNLAKHPYRFKLSGVGIYSIEELCYFLYNNSFLLREELFDEDLVSWLREEIDMPEMADKLHQMIEGDATLTDMVISLLCSCDYYDEKDVVKLAQELEQLEQLTVYGRKLRRGDNFLQFGNYAKAACEYESLLQSKELEGISEEEYAGLLHNLGVAYCHVSTYEEAAEWFLKAYEKGQQEASLKQYLFALKLSGNGERYANEIQKFHVTPEQKKEYEMELGKYLLHSDDDPVVSEVLATKRLRSQGRVNEYYQKIDKIIGDWKQEYRKEVR